MFDQLLFNKSFEEVAATMAVMSINECNEFLKSQLKATFLHLGISEEQYRRAIVSIKKLDFYQLVKVLEGGKYGEYL